MPIPGLRFPGLSAVFAAAAVAQSTPLPVELRCVHPWPEPQPQLGWKALRAQCCRVGVDDRLDVAVLRGADDGSNRWTLVYLPDFGRQLACVPLGPALDFVVVPQAGPGGADGLLTVQTDGTLTMWTGTAGPLPLPTVLGSWPGITRLWSAPNGGGTEIFGLDPLGNRLRHATWSGQGLGRTTTATTPVGTEVVASLDWDGDGVPEIVTAVDSSISVRRWNQAPVVTIPLPPQPSPVAPLLQVSRSLQHGDLLVTCIADGTDCTVAWANALTSGSIGLGAVAISAMTVYDRDGDGDDDLALADAAHSRLYVLQRQGTQFVLRSVDLLRGDVFPDGRIAALAGGDLDGDGDGDLVAFAAGSMATHTVRDGLVAGRGPLAVRGDLSRVVPGAAAVVPLDVALPTALPAMAAGGLPLAVRIEGWLVDPASGFTIPQHLIAQEAPILGAATSAHADLLLPAAAVTPQLLLQLQVAVVAIRPDGSRRSFPSQLLYLTPDPERAHRLVDQVAVELTGSLPAIGKDGDGDGNILGTKTTSHAIGVPPF